MSRTRLKWVLGLSATLALLLAMGFGLSTVLAKGGPTRVSGGGEATAGSVTYNVNPGETCGAAGVVHSATGPGSGALEDSTGNRFTFGFNATKDSDGNVHGQMQFVDHDLGLVIHSDVVKLDVPHPGCGAPVDDPTGLSFRMNGAPGDTGVVVNGEAKPGWRFVNSPGFDGGEGKGAVDTVCFELFNADGAKVRQWSAVLSAGNVQIVP